MAKAFITIDANTKHVRDMLGRFRDTMPTEFTRVTKEASKIYATEIQKMAFNVFKRGFASGELARSIKSIPIDPANGVYGVTAAKNIRGKIYAWYAELGRGPGKGPPFSYQFARWAEAWYANKQGQQTYIPKAGVYPHKILRRIIKKYGTKRHPHGRFIKPGMRIAHVKIKSMIQRRTRMYINSKGRSHP